ncbi:hypothetical protein [Streptomyces sp. TRM68416]|uniref:hypothetical protein n=1 Tax=Streptomyces sp. TRM68416 TaxID=2758412 RepID=UPI001661BEAF|nr:hypothetical protein [Streptomyces sp. TRM68416]MBD0840663.1 hypothetical protein [Streptomyces sp. TRM68416]
MNTALLSPAGWLVLALPWPAETRDGWGECAAVIAPSMIPRSLVSQEATTVLDLATALAGDTDEGLRHPGHRQARGAQYRMNSAHG